MLASDHPDGRTIMNNTCFAATRSLYSRALIGLIAVAFAARWIQAADNGLAESSANRNEFVAGDWYEVSVKCHGVKQQLTGMLVKTTDDWIVLALIQSQASMVETPWIGELPYVGQALRKQVETIYKSYRWIPRAAAHAEKRSTVTQDKVRIEFKDDDPSLSDMARVCWSDGNRHEDEFKQFKDGTVTIAARSPSNERPSKRPA